MKELDTAMARLDRAVTALETGLSVEGAPGGPGREVLEALESERDDLAAEVARLRAEAEDDARLRREAAEAVKSALSDLRAMTPGGDNRG